MTDRKTQHIQLASMAQDPGLSDRLTRLGLSYEPLLAQHNFEYDLIITDVRITGLTLYELSDYIAMNSGGESIPMIGMAEFPRDEEIMMTSGESFDLVIEKGFSSSELLDAVDSIVNIDTSLSEGMSEQQIKHRAQQLSDTSTVPLNQDAYMEAAQHYVQNRGHQNLIDKFKDM